MLIKELSPNAQKQLLSVGFKLNGDINTQIENSFSRFGICAGFFSFSPLHYAAYSGDVSLATELLDKKANLELQDEFFNYTPVMFAIMKGRASVTQLLIKKGARTSYPTNDREISCESVDRFSNKSGCCQKFLFFQQDKLQSILGEVKEPSDIEATRKVYQSRN